MPLVLMLGAALAGWAGTLLIMTVVRMTRVKYDSALGLMLSTTSLLLEELSFHTYPKARHLLVLFLVSIVENTDEDWSFGLGRAQFLTGEL